MDQLTQTIGDYQTFLQTVLGRVEKAGFDMADFVQCDHMGYRTTSLEQFKQKEQEFASIGKRIGGANINNRPISIFRLNTPVVSGTWRITAIELLAPREGNPLPEGLDHIEFVLYDDMQTFLEKYKDKDFERAAADRGINPEIKFLLGDGLCVKFHLHSITSVIYIQNKLGIVNIK